MPRKERKRVGAIREGFETKGRSVPEELQDELRPKTLKLLGEQEQKEYWKQLNLSYARKLSPLIHELLGPGPHNVSDEQALRVIFENYERIRDALRRAGYNGHLPAAMFADIINTLRLLHGQKGSMELGRLAEHLDDFVWRLLAEYPTLEHLERALRTVSRSKMTTIVLDLDTDTEEVYQEEQHPLAALFPGNHNNKLRRLARQLFPPDIDAIIEHLRPLYQRLRSLKNLSPHRT